MDKETKKEADMEEVEMQDLLEDEDEIGSLFEDYKSSCCNAKVKGGFCVKCKKHTVVVCSNCEEEVGHRCRDCNTSTDKTKCDKYFGYCKDCAIIND